MAWATTLEIVDSAVPTFKIQGASIFDDYGGGGYTDANGQLIYIVDDAFTQYGVRIGHPGATVHAAFGYINKTYILNRSSSSMIQTVPLQPAPDPGTGTTKCFIVTATTGAADSVEVSRLRQLRDRVATASRLGGQLIDVIYRDYAQFSPAIAVELERDVIARQAVRQVIVRPLLAWYTLAGTLAFEHADQRAVSHATQDVMNACPGSLGQSSIIPLLETLRAGAALPAETPPLIRDFAPRIQAAAQLRFASWAILDPLLRVWRLALEHREVVDEVAQWLATAPLEALTPPSDAQLLAVELRVLASFFDFRPRARRQLGERLTAAWPHAASALARAGFVAHALTNEEEQ